MTTAPGFSPRSWRGRGTRCNPTGCSASSRVRLRSGHGSRCACRPSSSRTRRPTRWCTISPPGAAALSVPDAAAGASEGTRPAGGAQDVRTRLLQLLELSSAGGRKPPGPPEGWAPDLTLASRRLNADWIARWLSNPQKLMPGTKMPTFYDPTTRKARPPGRPRGRPGAPDQGAERICLHAGSQARRHLHGASP